MREIHKDAKLTGIAPAAFVQSARNLDYELPKADVHNPARENIANNGLPYVQDEVDSGSNSEKSTGLPPSWEPCRDQDGKPFFWNNMTCESSRDRPAAGTKPIWQIYILQMF